MKQLRILQRRVDQWRMDNLGYVSESRAAAHSSRCPSSSKTVKMKIRFLYEAIYENIIDAIQEWLSP
jgi:hypothetical protein